MLRHWVSALLQALLQTTVRALQEELPGLGETVAFDVKHIYAWVKENNDRAYVPERYDKTKRLAGDPDCRLGVKRRDRKSTRLNSSHQIISYAVFCLKKKKQSS